MARAWSKIVLLAGGVGGGRMAEGFLRSLPSGALTVIANVADDHQFYDLHVSPDIDTLIYTLSGRVDRRQGWGVKDDRTLALTILGELGAPVWMKLGDADFGLHIWRSWRLREGWRLTEVTEEAARRLGAGARVLPATDDRLRTKLLAGGHWMDFQDWFVRARCEPPVTELRYDGASAAAPTPEVLSAIAEAEAIFVAPSNPFLSIEPILAVHGIRDALKRAGVPRIGVSPLIGGRAVKGPLAKLLADLGAPSGTRGIAERYADILDVFLVDDADGTDIGTIEALGISGACRNILMPDPAEAKRLAGDLLDLAARLTENGKI